MTTPAKHAYHYTRVLGWGIVPIPRGLKKPTTRDWQHNPVTDPDQARRIWEGGQNMGLLHSASGTCVIDVDHAEWLNLAAAHLDFDLIGLIEAAPVKIRGAKGAKPLYRVPDGLSLDFHKLTWPHPTERLKNGQPRTVTVVEFRCGAGRQDVLPPSIHPDTGRAYEWVGTPPRCREDIPELPAELVTFWENLAGHIATMKAACPWASMESAAAPQPVRSSSTPFDGDSDIDAFCAYSSVEEQLEAWGAKRAGDRYLSPNSGSGDAGIEVYTDEKGRRRAVTYHESDDWADKRGHDAFDLFCMFQHGGDFRAALTDARRLMGRERPQPVAPLTAEQVSAAWNAGLETFLDKAARVLGDMSIHHHAKSAAWNVIYHIASQAAEGHVAERGGQWCVMVGGLKGIKHALGGGGTLGDISARLKWLADQGFLGKVERTDPDSRYSPLAIRIPANPADLPAFRRAREELQAVTTPPLTRAVRNPATPSQSEEPATPPTEPSEATPVGRVELLTRCLRPVLLNERRGEPLPVRVREALRAEGLEGATFAQLRAELTSEIEADTRRRLRLQGALEASAAHARHIRTLARLGVKSVQRAARSVPACLKRTAAQLARLADGEPMRAVIGVAA